MTNLKKLFSPKAEQQSDRDIASRPTRFESHALVDIRLSRWNPFSMASAVLLDISTEGFKIEFVNQLKTLRAGCTLKMYIPLTPFHIASSDRLKLHAHVRWFDTRTQRAGGVFAELTAEQRFYLEKIIVQLRELKAS